MALSPGEKIQLALLRFLGACIGFTGYGGVTWLGEKLGALAWRVLPSRRKVAIANIAAHLPLSPAGAEKLARESFGQNFRSFLEIFISDHMDLSEAGKKLSCDDLSILLRVAAANRPIVAATGHFGSWEMLAGILGDCRRYFDGPLMAVARENSNRALQKFMTEKRQKRGCVMVGHTKADLMLRALRQHGAVAFLVDHKPIRREALYLPFLGESTAVNKGPALLAVASGALILPVYMARENGNYHLIVEEPLDTLTLAGSQEEKIAAAALFYTHSVENIIRRYPEQWFWMHKRWSPPA